MSVEWILSSCVLILFIMLLRLLFRKKISPRVRYALWLAAALRLLLPVSFSQTAFSVLNLLPENAASRNVPDSLSLVEPDNVAIDGAKSADKSADAGVGSVEADIKETEWWADIEWQTGAAGETESDKTENADVIESTDVTKRSDMTPGIVLQKIPTILWLIGTGVCAAIFFLVNLDYSRRLMRSRKRIADENLPIPSAIPVFETEIVPSPCLFGLFHPAVYVMKRVAENEKKFIFVLSHENTHYRHRDNWWALLRILCVCLHWYNPFVWVGAYLSKQDAELACDEKTLKNLGDEVRIAYGEALLSLCAVKISGMDRWRISTTMSGRGNQLRERLQMIVHVPKKSAGAYLLLFMVTPIVLAAAFTGREKTAEAKQANQEEAKQEETEQEEAEQIETEIGTETDIAASEPRADFILPDADESSDRWKYIPLQAQNEEDGAASYDGMFVNEQKDGARAVIYCRYDEENSLHMVRYTEENPSSDAVFEKMDLTYVEDDGMYTMQATVDDDFYLTAIAMAKQALTELYQWTGEKVDTAYFQVSNIGGVAFTVTADDMKHSRVFFSRYFGADTDYNISGYDNLISSITIASGRAVWYSPVLWRYFPYAVESMTDEEVIIWYVERMPVIDGDKVVSIEKRYEDMWTIQTESGSWFEVVYNRALREVYDVTGPYYQYPEH